MTAQHTKISLMIIMINRSDEVFTHYITFKQQHSDQFGIYVLLSLLELSILLTNYTYRNAIKMCSRI